MCAIQGIIYVFGGIFRDEDDDQDVVLDDLFMLKTDGNTVTAESIPIPEGSITPGGRAFAMMQAYGDDSLMLFGGVKEGKPLNDAFMFNIGTQKWTQVFRGDPSGCNPTGEITTLHAGKLLKVSSGGGGRFDVVATLDLASLASGFSFSSVMKSGATAQLDAL